MMQALAALAVLSAFAPQLRAPLAAQFPGTTFTATGGEVWLTPQNGTLMLSGSGAAAAEWWLLLANGSRERILTVLSGDPTFRTPRLLGTFTPNDIFAMAVYVPETSDWVDHAGILGPIEDGFTAEIWTSIGSRNSANIFGLTGISAYRDNIGTPNAGSRFPDGPPLVIPPVVVTPEPATIFLMATGLLGVGVVMRRRRKAA